MLYWFLNSKLFRVHAEGSRTGTAQWNFGPTHLKQFSIPIPPLAEQRRIVRRIESAFARIDKFAAEAACSTALLDRLDQATLAKAFQGELLANGYATDPVPQAIGKQLRLFS